MLDHPVATREDWLAARKSLLEEEKEFTRAKDALSAKRRALPWVRIDKPYRFEGPEGALTLSDLFGSKRQLIVQHFMFAPDWETPCKSCSFWADGYNGVVAHLAQRDTAFVAVSRAPLEKLEARKRKMGWTFPWVSSGRRRLQLRFRRLVPRRGSRSRDGDLQLRRKAGVDEGSAGRQRLRQGDDGAVYHAYSCFARGLDILNPAYNYLDLTPLGRQEEGLPFPMSWVKLHDEYEA